MGRHARYDKEQISKAALDLIAEGGPAAATVVAIAGRLGAPVGSIYHRYPSRESILAELWLETTEAFQNGLIQKLGREGDYLEAGVEAALFSSQWLRFHPTESRLLMLHRREDLIGPEWPEAVRERADALKRDLSAAVRAYARRLYGEDGQNAVRKVRFAVLEMPYGALKRYAEEGRKPPADIDRMIGVACRAVLDEG